MCNQYRWSGYTYFTSLQGTIDIVVFRIDRFKNFGLKGFSVLRFK